MVDHHFRPHKKNSRKKKTKNHTAFREHCISFTYLQVQTHFHTNKQTNKPQIDEEEEEVAAAAAARKKLGRKF
jgi:hypothetical protein